MAAAEGAWGLGWEEEGVGLAFSGESTWLETSVGQALGKFCSLS